MDIDYKLKLPQNQNPICIIGAGGIVRDAHLPAYCKAGFEIVGIADKKIDKAEKLADQYDIPNVYGSAKNAINDADQNVIFDLALMPDQSIKVLQQLPKGSHVLIQKPMGENFDEARKIYSICKDRNLHAAINFQLRFAPFVRAARSLIEKGLIGEIYDMEIRLTTYTPWEIFPSVMHKERLEILYHSIHYIDLIRSFLGDPAGVMAKTLQHPNKSLTSTRSTILFDYGDTIHAVINANHDHEFGPNNQESFIKWEGTKGAIKAKMGLLLNYPEGLPDKFEYCIKKEDTELQWKQKELEGSWFPDAFIGTVSSLMRFKEGEEEMIPTRIDDAVKTMAVVESAYQSNTQNGNDIHTLLNKL